MEKFRMAKRRLRFIFGLLIFKIAFSAAPIFPQAAEPLAVFYEISEAQFEMGRAFTLTLVIDHPELLEVNVKPPDFGGAFRLTRQETSVRILRDEALNAKRWTVFLFTLVPLVEGEKIIRPFTVEAAGKIAYTQELSLFVAASRTAAPPLVFRWETPLPSLRVGKWAQFRLLVSDTRNLFADSLANLRFEPTPIAIVESAALLIPSAPAQNTAVIELRVLPMRAGEFHIPSFTTSALTPAGSLITFSIPELKSIIYE